MEQLQIQNLYDLTQTIAAPLFEGATYPWELLPKISAFIIELATVCQKTNTRSVERMYGLQNLLPFSQPLILTDHVLLTRKQR